MQAPSRGASLSQSMETMYILLYTCSMPAVMLSDGHKEKQTLGDHVTAAPTTARVTDLWQR